MLVKQVLLVAFFLLGSFLSIAEGGKDLDLDAYFDELDKNASQERVVGGASIPKNERIPYQVSLQYLKGEKHRHFCGGSIISPTHILTAAHCLSGQDAKRLSVVAGIRDLNDKTGQRSKLQNYTIHEKYNQFVSSDIAMAVVDPPFELDGKKVDKIDFHVDGKVGGGQEVILTGWGSIHHFGIGILANYPDVLQRITYSTISNEECKKKMSGVSDTEICALERFGKGACNGDSGGPLVMVSDDNIKQVGIVSYGTSLCASNSPDVYTRVSMFNEWIENFLK